MTEPQGVDELPTFTPTEYLSPLGGFNCTYHTRTHPNLAAHTQDDLGRHIISLLGTKRQFRNGAQGLGVIVVSASMPNE